MSRSLRHTLLRSTVVSLMGTFCLLGACSDDDGGDSTPCAAIDGESSCESRTDCRWTCGPDIDERSCYPTGDAVASLGCETSPPDAGDATSDTASDAVSDVSDGSTDADGGEVEDTTRDMTSETGNGGGGDDGGMKCMSDQACPGRSVCEEGDCRFYRVVQIRDITSDRSEDADTACEENAAGADLFQLELQDPFGKPLGYGKVAAAKVTADANDDVAQVFDGRTRSLEMKDGAQCPSDGFGPNTTVSLGCGGQMAVFFTDGAGDIVNLATGQQLAIHEYGDQCCPEGESCPRDYWELRICGTQTPDSLSGTEPKDHGHFATCNSKIVATGTGATTATIELPEMAPTE